MDYQIYVLIETTQYPISDEKLENFFEAVNSQNKTFQLTKLKFGKFDINKEVRYGCFGVFTLEPFQVEKINIDGKDYHINENMQFKKEIMRENVHKFLVILVDIFQKLYSTDGKNTFCSYFAKGHESIIENSRIYYIYNLHKTS